MLVTVLGLLLVVAAAIFVTWPLLRGDEIAAEKPGPATWSEERIQLEKQKQTALAAIREADFDHRVGKLSNEDYAALRAEHEARALHAMEAIDSSEAGQARSERVSETRKASREPGKPARKFCTACGQPIQPSATFCAGCGKSLARAASGADSDRHRATR